MEHTKELDYICAAGWQGEGEGAAICPPVPVRQGVSRLPGDHAYCIHTWGRGGVKVTVSIPWLTPLVVVSIGHESLVGGQVCGRRKKSV